MVFVETDFPRGGIPKATSTADNQPKIEFGANVTKHKKEKLNKKQREEKRKLEIEEKEDTIEAVSAELLNFKTLTDGMILMGSVVEIQPTYLTIALPGRLSGQVSITSISKAYQNILNKYVNDVESVQDYKPIENLFEIGQLVCVKVIQMDLSDENGKYKINLSMNPSDVHSDFHHQQIKKGLIMCVAIEEIQDHGYIIETGVNNLRGFLPLSDAPPDLCIGQIISCKIEQAKIASSASTAIYKFVETSARVLKPNTEPILSCILPTTIVKFKITKIHKDGLQGTIMNDLYTGYINEHQLSTSLSSPDDYEIDSIYSARVLYVMPITKLIYLSLNLDKLKLTIGDGSINIGSTINNARVLRIGTSGVILKLNENCKGIISMKSIHTMYNSNYDYDDLMDKYHANSLHRVRIIAYDPMDSFYICSVNQRIMDEKHFLVGDVQIGDFVDAKINRKLENGDLYIQVGNIKGYIEKVHISPITPIGKLVKDTKLRCRVLRKNEKCEKLFLTNRKEYLSKTASLLTSYEKAVVGQEYHGMIVKIYSDRYLVGFCNYVKGMLYTKNLDEISKNITQSFNEGQIMKFRVTDINSEGQIILGLADYKCQTGAILNGIVADVQPSGLHVAFKNTIYNGFVPTMFLSTFPNLAVLVQESYQSNESIDAVCITQNVYSVKDTIYIREKSVKEWSNVSIGDIVPAFVKNVSGEVIDLQLLIENYSKILKIHARMVLEDYTKISNINLVAEQLLFVRIIGKYASLDSITCSAKLSDVWHGNLSETANIFIQYFKDLNRIKSIPVYRKDFQNFNPGVIVSGTVDYLNSETGAAYIAFPNSNNVKGLITNANLSKNQLEIGQTVNCLVIWIDFANRVVYLTMKQKFIERAKKEKGANLNEKMLIHSKGIKADVLVILDDLIITYPRKLTNKFIYIPNRFHYNDLQPVISQGIAEGDIANVTLIAEPSDHLIGMFENICKALEKLKNNFKVKKEVVHNNGETIKRKRLNSADLFITDKQGKHKKIKTEEKPTAIINFEKLSLENQVDGSYDLSDNDSSDEELVPANKTNLKRHNADGARKNMKKNTQKKQSFAKKRKLENPTNLTILPGVNNFWNTDLNVLNKEKKADCKRKIEIETVQSDVKKKPLTSAERFKVVRDEEARINKIELSLINGEHEPTTVDDFDRIVLASPSDSQSWIKYMVFYLQTKNVDEARKIAKKALTKISYREEQERFNIWIALINLELRYNDMESFENTIKEAILVNDPFKIYAKCLQMLADVEKVQELSNMVIMFTKKFRNNPECWPIAATAYFEVGLPEKAKQLLNRALASLPERDHINTIVKFANLNNKYDNKNTAHALLEQIVVSYPKRVDCWSQYVDMLVKDKEIELARQILDRAVSQKIPMKKMRTLFKKYLEFEEKFGNEINVKKVKAMACNYVKNEIKV